jgi:hypothetical protein
LRLFLAVLLVASVFASPSPHHNENRTLDLVRAMSQGRLTIDADASNTVDKAFVPDVAGVGSSGHFYSGGAPGLAFALLPAYVAARPAILDGLPAVVLPESLLVLFLTLVGAALPLAVGAVGVRRAVVSATDCSPGTATLAACLHAFGTIALPFGTKLYAHSLTIALLAWALASLLRSSTERKDDGEPRFALAGFLAAFAVVCDYNVALLAAALGLLAFVRGGVRGALAFGLGALPPALLLMGYQKACFGSPFDTPYDHHADRGTQAIVKAGYGFSYPRPRILLELFFGVRRGFLFTQPAVLVGLVGLALSLRGAAARRAPAFALALGAALVAILSNAGRVHDWHSGSSYGARYCAAALPFVALGYPRVLDALGRAPRIALAVLTFAAAGLGATTDWGRSIFSNLDSLRILGPRACGLSALLLHVPPDTATFATALTGTLALAIAVPLAWKILRPGTRAEALLALGVGLWVVGAPGVTGAFEEGNLRIGVLRREIARDEIRRAIPQALDAEEALNLLRIADAMQDGELFRAALARLVDLDPGNAKAAELLRSIAATESGH